MGAGPRGPAGLGQAEGSIRRGLGGPGPEKGAVGARPEPEAPGKKQTGSRGAGRRRGSRHWSAQLLLLSGSGVRSELPLVMLAAGLAKTLSRHTWTGHRSRRPGPQPENQVKAACPG